jgi:hypothetical protein
VVEDFLRHSLCFRFNQKSHINFSADPGVLSDDNYRTLDGGKRKVLYIAFGSLSLMMERINCLFIAVNQISFRLMGLKYKKFQPQSWSEKLRRSVGVGNCRKLRGPSSTPSTGPSAGLDALQNTKLFYCCQVSNHHSLVV